MSSMMDHVDQHLEVMQTGVVIIKLERLDENKNQVLAGIWSIDRRLLQRTCQEFENLEDVDQQEQTLVTLVADSSIPYYFEAHKLLLNYADTGSLPDLDVEDADTDQPVLVTAWHLGNELGVSKFQNAVMLKLLEAGLQAPTPEDAVALIYKIYAEGSAIRNFIAEQVALAIVRFGTVKYAALDNFKDIEGALAEICSALAEYHRDMTAFEDRASVLRRDRYMLEEPAEDRT